MISRGISLVASLCCVGISMYCVAFEFGLAGPVTEPLANRVVAFFFAFVMASWSQENWDEFRGRS